MVFINKRCCQKKVYYCCLQLSECSKDKRKMWHLRGFPWCIASVLSYVSRALWYRCALLRALCDVHCTTCTLLCALCKMHCATFLADLEVLQACAEQMQYRSCPCMIATVMSSSVHTFSSAWCSLVQLDAAYKFSAWWSSNAFQVDAMFKFLAWYNSCVPCSCNVRVLGLMQQSVVTCDRLAYLASPLMIEPLPRYAFDFWLVPSWTEMTPAFLKSLLPSNWVLTGEGVVPRVINPRQRWWSCWGRRQVCKIQKQSETGRSTITITQGMNMIEVIKNVVEKCQLWWSDISGIGANLGSRLSRQQGMPHYFAKGG